MATQEQIVTTRVPEYISDRQQELLNTLFGTPQAQGVLQLPQTIPQQQIAGFSPTQEAAMNLAFQGIGSFQPFIQASQAAQTAGLGSAAAGAEALRQMNFEPSRVQQFMDPYQQAVTQEAIKEIDRQAALAQNQLAGQAVKAGAFGGSRFGIQQSELARSAQDLRSRRIFEDLSRNFQQAQATANAANQQRAQQAAGFANIGKLTSGIGSTMAGLGAQTQQLGQQDVSQLLGIGGLQQQQDQQQLSAQYQNQLNQMMEPFRRISFGSQTLQQVTPGAGTAQQTIAPMPTTNPFAQAAGIITGGIGGLGALVGN